MFVHTAILEAVVFGDTKISVQDLRVAVRNLNKPNPSADKTSLEEQFEVFY